MRTKENDKARTGSCENEASRMQIAFLFLTISDHHQADVWRAFLAKAPPGTYRIYSHAKRTLDASAWLAPYRIAERVMTKWAHISLVVATVALLQAALQDPTNTYFILCSESCIPIAPFAHLHEFLCERAPAQMSFFCYNPDYHKTKDCEQRYARFGAKEWISEHRFRKADQWWILHRAAAAACVRERDRLWRFDRVFAADEHFFINVVDRLGLPFQNRWSTYADYEVDRSHPVLFRRLSRRFLALLRARGFFFLRKVPPEVLWID